MYSNPHQWWRIRKRVLVSGESKRRVAASEGISRTTLRKMLAFETPPGYCGRNPAIPEARPLASRQIQSRSKAADVKRLWMEWLYGLEQGEATGAAAKPILATLASRLSLSANDPRKKILTVLAHARGFSANAIAEHLNVSRNSVRKHLSAFERGGSDGLLSRKLKTRKADDASFKKALFSLLHEPPSLSGHNRTTWRMQDLQKTMEIGGTLQAMLLSGR